MKALEWSQHFSHCKSKEIFPDAKGQLTCSLRSDLADFEPYRDFTVVLVICKNEEDPITKRIASSHKIIH